MPTIVSPETLAPPRGYSNGITYEAGRLLFVAGQIGWDREMNFPSDDMPGQFEQALRNVLAVVTEAGGAPEHIARFTIYVTDKPAYIRGAKDIGVRYREQMGKHYPAMTLVEVKSLLEARALVEIEATAVLP
ncbi:MAG: RidA family protein [Myxococcota bacterium]